jgi:hypothetical protein
MQQPTPGRKRLHPFAVAAIIAGVLSTIWMIVMPDSLFGVAWFFLKAVFWVIVVVTWPFSGR